MSHNRVGTGVRFHRQSESNVLMDGHTVENLSGPQATWELLLRLDSRGVHYTTCLSGFKHQSQPAHPSRGVL